ncbi:unnamed protein product [Rotaria magnacalcarata]|uniref:AB hydrolase-1 domain-containing protein n=1 Tax=Rotaria magnacalcarata TaxID=392030 RepID=A0A814YFU6_9BILA|nr:unnamed protein product [Rotaria magnacalcarata]
MKTYIEDYENVDVHSISSSNALDLMILTSMCDLAYIAKSLLGNKPSELSQWLVVLKNTLVKWSSVYFSSCYITSPSQRKHRIAFRNRFSKRDPLRRLAWTKTGLKQVERAEMRILETLKSHFDGCYVSILSDTHRIWTMCSNIASTNIPSVLIHGFGGGVGIWSLDLDHLYSDRSVYAIDLSGCARSTRPIFSLDSKEVEKQMVDMIEEWRREIGLNEQFILLGHSFGGFISAAYTISYSNYVKQLVLVDPWGFAQKPENIWQTERLQLHAVGSLGIPAIKYFRADLREKFSKLFDDDRILVYIYHCNAQLPTEPIIERIPIYFLRGEQSWITIESSLIMQSRRRNDFVETINDAGHHIYADSPEDFEMYLRRILYNHSI